jgi:hypothetical protein
LMYHGCKVGHDNRVCLLCVADAGCWM